MVANSTTPNPVTLPNLLPTPYHIIYASLLLVLSFPLTFAGAFLTLDRTRQFAPTSLATEKKEKGAKWRLEGGAGGLVGGFIFGVHASTLLALLIINKTSSTSLGSIQFLVVWLLSAVALALLGGRFKYAALPMLGLGGGAAFSLFISVACHPSLLARRVLLAVFALLSSVLCLLPVPNLQHATLRTATAFFGALGMIVSISILSDVSDWGDVWARLWVPWDDDWGTSQEKGLTAAFFGLAAVGFTCDWLLKRQFGECPDEKWDNFLASYAANLPTGDREGTFQPSLPFWKKFVNPPAKEPIAFPPDKALLSTRTPLSPPPYRAGKLRTQGKKSKPWKGGSFQPLSKHDNDSSGDSSDEDGQENNGRYIPRPWAKRKDTQATSLSGVTLADATSSHSKDKAKSDVDKGEVVYSDGESVAPPASLSDRRKEDRDAPGWTPEFIKRHLGEDGKKLSPPISRTRTASPPPGAVPMTPSLLRALDRVSQAQNDAYGGIISRGHTPQASMPGHAVTASTAGQVHAKMEMPATPAGYDWTGFWRNVEEKAKDDGAARPKPKTTR